MHPPESTGARPCGLSRGLPRRCGGDDMSGLKQPWTGVAATALIIVIALAFISLFPIPLFTGWVSYFLLCVIPMQIIVAVVWHSDPAFTAGQRQPVKGLMLILSTLVVGVLVLAATFMTIGGGIS